MRLDEMYIALERDVFLRSLIRELSGVLEDVVGKKKLRDFLAHGSRAAAGRQIVSAHRGTVIIQRAGEGTTLGCPYR